MQAGQFVRVRGQLGVGGLRISMAGCEPKGERATCCNGASGPVVLRDDGASLELRGFKCVGDDSQLCCDAPAYGQTVVASGRLFPEDPSGAKWALERVTLCVEDNNQTGP